VEVVKDRETKTPFDPYDAKVRDMPTTLGQAAAKAMAAGVYVVPMINTFIVAPPLIISEAQIDEGVRGLREALGWLDTQL